MGLREASKGQGRDGQREVRRSESRSNELHTISYVTNSTSRVTPLSRRSLISTMVVLLRQVLARNGFMGSTGSFDEVTKELGILVASGGVKVSGSESREEMS